MDANFIHEASHLILARNRIGFLLKAIEEKHPVAVQITGLDIGFVLDPSDVNGLETDLRKQLAAIDDQLIGEGVEGLVSPVPTGSLTDEINRLIGHEDEDEDDEDDESAAA